MSLIPHSIFPRRMMDSGFWNTPMTPLNDMKQMMMMPKMGPTSLEMFDPFDELDTLMTQDIDWLHKPDFLPVQPRVQQKYRITVDCPGFVPQKHAIKTDIKGNVLTVSGREEDKEPSGDYSVQEFKKSYTLPENVMTDKMVSFMPMAGTLVVEFPLKESKMHLNVDLMPKIIDTDKGKAVTMTFGVPENIDPSKVHVSIKDRDLIVKAEDTKKTKDSTSKIHYYKRTTMPANTDFDKLNIKWDQHKLLCNAPLKTEMRSIKNVPIDRPMEIQQ